jgi:hypothetical protein
LLRVTVLILALVAVTAVFLAARIGEEKIRALEKPELRPAPAIAEIEQKGPVKADTVPDPDERSGGQTEEFAEIRIGSFQRPEEVPEYEILAEEPDERDGARAVRLLVDTHSHAESDFELIARDLKARYADLDAVSVEFTDAEDVLDYNGGALIFNTTAGVSYLGYIYRPPNMKGYYVKAAD